MNKINHVILAILDDVKSKDFYELIGRGLLPNFKKLMNNGIFSESCITDFPAVTFPSHPSIITGTYTGNYLKEPSHGIPLFNWMDRSFKPPILRSYGSKDLQIYKLNEDLGKNCRTLPEMINEGKKVSISQFINRGVDFFFPENRLKLILYYLLLHNSISMKNMMMRVNSVIVHKLIDTFRNPTKYFSVNEPPIASIIWFMTPDILMHVYGYDSTIYKLNLIHIDKVLGFLCRNLDLMGYLEDTAIAIISDHGNYKANLVGDLTSFLRRNGLIQYKAHPKKIRNRKANVNIAEFDGVGFFYFKSRNLGSTNNSWISPSVKELKNFGSKKIDILNRIFQIKGAEIIAYRGDNCSLNKGNIHLTKKDKKTGKLYNGTISYEGSGKKLRTKYISEYDENDIFGYSNEQKVRKLINKGFHSIDEWEKATGTHNYPLYPDLISRHFKNPRSCDLILFTDGSVIYNLKHGKKKNNFVYSHDLGTMEGALVPLIISGAPSIPIKRLEYCKITDVVPTLLKMLGKKPHKSICGKSLI